MALALVCRTQSVDEAMRTNGCLFYEIFLAVEKDPGINVLRVLPKAGIKANSVAVVGDLTSECVFPYARGAPPRGRYPGTQQQPSTRYKLRHGVGGARPR